MYLFQFNKVDRTCTSFCVRFRRKLLAADVTWQTLLNKRYFVYDVCTAQLQPAVVQMSLHAPTFLAVFLIDTSAMVTTIAEICLTRTTAVRRIDIVPLIIQKLLVERMEQRIVVP